MIHSETEDSKNPFSKDYILGSHGSDFGVNKFSSEQAPNNPSKIYTGQAQFPQFGDAQSPQSTAGENKNILEQIESAKNNGWGAQLSKFIGSHKKRIAVIAAIVLLFAGGSYMSNRNDSESAPLIGGIDVSENISSTENKMDEVEVNGNGLSINPKNANVNVLDIKMTEDGEVIFDETEETSSIALSDSSSITKTASMGEGITHLARSAIKDYLAATNKNLGAEQKIYAEDYVQNAIGNEWLEVGQKLSFSNELLNEAVERAGQLRDWQIENLTQYTYLAAL